MLSFSTYLGRLERGPFEKFGFEALMFVVQDWAYLHRPLFLQVLLKLTYSACW